MSKGKDKKKKNKRQGGGVFNELLGMFKRKRPNRDDDHEASRRSPVRTDLVDDRLRGSKDSLGFSRMDETEIEKEFFSNKWAVSKHKTPSSPALRSKSKQKVDLNVVSTTKALSNAGAKHKMAVRQNKRPSSQHRARRPRSPPAPISPLAQVSEEVPSAGESPFASDTEDRAPTPVRDDEELDKRHSIYPPKASERESDSEPEVVEVHEVKPKVNEVEEIKPEVHEVKPEVHETKPEVHEVKVEDNKENVEPVVDEIKEEPKQEIKPEPKHEEHKKEEPPKKQEVETKKEDEPPKNAFGGVQLRRTGKLSNIGEHGTLRADKIKDATKRQTIAGDSAVVTVFTGSKVAQRSSVHEPKDWEKLETKIKKEPEVQADSGGGSEFTNVFAKLKKRNSTNIAALVEADAKHADHSPTKESKPFVTEAKSVETERKPSFKRDSKPVVREEPKAEPKVEPAPKVEPTPKVEPARTEPKSVLKAEEPKTERPRSISPGATDSNKHINKPVVVTEKPKDLNKDKAEPFRRDSPILKDRERSKTIGTPPMAQKSETKSSPIVKRTHSQKVTPSTTTSTTTTTSNSPQTEPEKRLVLKPAPKWEPKKPEEPSSNTGGAPSWIAMARRKTTGWDENRDPEKEMKEASNKAKKEDDDENRKSNVMDLMKNFQIN